MPGGAKSSRISNLSSSTHRALRPDGVDLATVARQVGHSNVQTTARYDRRDQKTQQRGVLRLEVPFLSR